MAFLLYSFLLSCIVLQLSTKLHYHSLPLSHGVLQYYSEFNQSTMKNGYIPNVPEPKQIDYLWGDNESITTLL